MVNDGFFVGNYTSPMDPSCYFFMHSQVQQPIDDHGKSMAKTSMLY